MITPRGGLLSPAEIAAHPWTFRCEAEGCYHVVCADTEQDAELLRFTHGCPRKGSNMIGKSLLQQAWEQLDADVDEIMAAQARFDTANQRPALDEIRERELKALHRDVVFAQARARGKAEILALFMIPHFTTADEISVEAGARYAARVAGVYHLTPGMTR